MKRNTKAVAASQTASRADSEIFGIVGAVALGLILLFSAGFAQATVMHDSTHDMRHALAFPCH